MRWLLLINLLALVVLSGAIAVVLEGTPIGARFVGVTSPEIEPIPPTVVPDIEVSDATPLALVPTDDLATENAQVEVEAAPGSQGHIPLPLQPPRFQVSTEAPDQQTSLPSDRTINLLKVATEGDFAPFNFRDGLGNPAGFDIDLAKEVCRRIGRACSFEAMQWSALQPALNEGQVDLLAASMQIPSIVPSGVLFSDPYYGAGGRFVGPVDVNLDAKVEASKADQSFPSAHAQIAVQRGSRHAAFLADAYPQTSLVMTSTFDEAMRMVEAGKVEGAFGDNVAALWWLKNRPCCLAIGQPLNHPLYFGNGVGLVVRSGDEDLLARINRALSEMIADGTYAKLSNTHFGVSIFDE